MSRIDRQGLIMTIASMKLAILGALAPWPDLAEWFERFIVDHGNLVVAEKALANRLDEAVRYQQKDTAQLVSALRDLEVARDRLAALERKDAGKSAEIRRLSAAVDAEHIRSLITAAVTKAVDDRDAEIRGLRSEVATQANQIRELRVSKSRLRDALDRLKGQSR